MNIDRENSWDRLGTVDAGPVFDGGLCIQCADPVLSDQEDPGLVELRRSGIFCMTGVSTGDHSGRRVRRWRPRSGPGISQESRRL